MRIKRNGIKTLARQSIRKGQSPVRCIPSHYHKYAQLAWLDESIRKPKKNVWRRFFQKMAKAFSFRHRRVEHFSPEPQFLQWKESFVC